MQRYFFTHIAKIASAKDTGLTLLAKHHVNSSLCMIGRTISRLAELFTELQEKTTLGLKEFECSLEYYVACKNTRERMLEKAKLATEKFKTKKEDVLAKHSSRQEKSEIVFPPSITEKFLRKNRKTKNFSSLMITADIPIYLACILETICEDILNNCNEIAKLNNHMRITIRDLEIGIENEKTYLNTLYKKCDIHFIGGGTIPISIPIPKTKTRNASSLREVKKYQKTTHLMLAKAPFERMVREVCREVYENDTEPFLSKEIFPLLQRYMEQYLLTLLKKANELTRYCGRTKTVKEDLNFVVEKMF